VLSGPESDRLARLRERCVLESYIVRRASRKVRSGCAATGAQQVSQFVQIKSLPDIVEKEDSEAAAEEHEPLSSLKTLTGIAGMHGNSLPGLVTGVAHCLKNYYRKIIFEPVLSAEINH
jgi:hypothetical protein